MQSVSATSSGLTHRSRRRNRVMHENFFLIDVVGHRMMLKCEGGNPASFTLLERRSCCSQYAKRKPGWPGVEAGDVLCAER